MKSHRDVFTWKTVSGPGFSFLLQTPSRLQGVTEILCSGSYILEQLISSRALEGKIFIVLGFFLVPVSEKGNVGCGVLAWGLVLDRVHLVGFCGQRPWLSAIRSCV